MLRNTLKSQNVRRLLLLSPLMSLSNVKCYSAINTNLFSEGFYMQPHPEKVHKGGEDAYFANSRVLSVADGVGGWVEHGVDPAIYSRKLCKNIEELTDNDWESYKTNPKKLLTDSWAKNQEDGSSTLVVVTLPESENRVYTSYIGDSGYLILRRDSNSTEVVHMSQSQQKGFNFPFQLGWGRNGDHPRAALEFNHEVKTGDIIVVGTDGLFDNLDEYDISGLVDSFLKSHNYDSKELAEYIGQEAFKASVDTRRESPFGREARKAGYRYNGGKSDDITVVVGRVHLRNIDAEDL